MIRKNVIYDEQGRILKAGGIVINDDNEILLYQSGGKNFSFPKGHQGPNETAEECSHREVREETGLETVIIDYLPPMIYRNTALEKEVYVEMFLMKPLSRQLLPEFADEVLIWADFETAVEKLKPDKEYYYGSWSDYLVENKGNIYREKVLTADGVLLKAGALVYRDKGSEWLLTYRSKWKDYSFLKGHLESGESFEEAAKREVLEESGCEIRIVKPIDDFYYDYPESGKVCVKMFLAECTSESGTHEDFEQPVWVKKEDVVETLTYDNLKEYFSENVKELEL